MALRLWSAVLLVALGGVVLFGAATADAPPGEAYQYTVLEVQYDDELVVRESGTGDWDPAVDVEIDERLVCLPSTTAECVTFHERFENDTPLATGVDSRFEYAYFDHQLYAIERTGLATLDFVAVDATTALEDLAMDWEAATAPEREAVEQGSVVTDRPIRHENRLLQRGDSYYTIVGSAYSDGSFCTSGGDGFCEGAAASHLRWQWARPLGLGLLGLAGIVAGLANLFPYLPYSVRRRVKNAL